MKWNFTKDVPEGQWYTEAVKWAAANGVVNGYSEDVFGSMDDVTREQIVTILYRYAQFRGVDVSKGETAYLNGYNDSRDIADWAVKAFCWAVDADVIQGMTATTLSPKKNAVRAQVATMLMRYSSIVAALLCSPATVLVTPLRAAWNPYQRVGSADDRNRAGYVYGASEG